MIQSPPAPPPKPPAANPTPADPTPPPCSLPNSPRRPLRRRPGHFGCGDHPVCWFRKLAKVVAPRPWRLQQCSLLRCPMCRFLQGVVCGRIASCSGFFLDILFQSCFPFNLLHDVCLFNVLLVFEISRTPIPGVCLANIQGRILSFLMVFFSDGGHLSWPTPIDRIRTTRLILCHIPDRGSKSPILTVSGLV